ncbi:hypothetical protein F4553_000186 [Allocatelliglobosispora scoriae]|uniref:Secreted protein n=1 Tax=Allocatelliglobosispora scoriae TaxID=643052 RepID=A0A841BCH2_9ACTN|nr:hypothetical protein [Allocatelliglobosispora scoriae]MBB5866807.1 hypothetical protein [Allocatelliglobosispora scoriae]
MIQPGQPLRRRRLATAATSLALVLAGIFVAPTAAQAGTAYVDVWAACEQQYGQVQQEPVLVSYNVYGWRCQAYTGTTQYLGTVNLTPWCVSRYGSHAYANYTNYSHPYSWLCYFWD